MKTFTEILRRKIEHVRSVYSISESNDFTEVGEIDISMRNVYESMQRWHINAHMADNDWLLLFDRIKVKLPSEEHYEANIMPSVMQKYLDNKFKKTNLKEMFTISQIFSNEFEETVLRHFKCSTNEDRADEFDTEFVFTGYNLAFYQRVFLPLAVYFTYKEKHPETDVSELLHDCFDIGAGSKRYDLCPEVNPYCNECCEATMVNCKWEEKNYKVFKMQVDNNFQMPLDNYSDSEDSESMEYDNALNCSNSSGEKIFNPFIDCVNSVSDLVSEEEEPPREDIYKYECCKCFKKFSIQVFLQYHTELMHGEDNGPKTQTCSKSRKPLGVKSVEAVFIPEPVDMITSFVHKSPKKVKSKFVSEPVELITSFSKGQPQPLQLSKITRSVTNLAKKDDLLNGKQKSKSNVRKHLFID